MSKKPVIDTLPEMERMAREKQRTNAFNKIEKIAKTEKDNIRLLTKFIEVQEGKQSSIPKVGVQASPVMENHSLHLKKRLDEMQELNEKNASFLDRIKKVGPSEAPARELEAKW